MKNYKILHLHSGIGDTGGIAHYISHLLKIKNNNRIKSFVTGSKIERKKVINANLFESSKIIFVDIERYGLISLFFNVLKLKKVVNNNSIDLIHAHALRSGLLALVNNVLFRKKYIYTNHGLRFTQKNNYLKKFIFYIYEFLTIIFSDYSFCIRSVDYRTIIKFPLNFLFKHKLKLLKTKLKLPKYCSIKKEANNITIIGIGSLIDVKRPEFFLNIISELYKLNKNITAIWIGDGYLKKKMINMNKTMNAPVKWLGHLNHDEIEHYLSHANLALLTSKFEVYPLSIIEAYWAGVPVISYDFFGINDFIQNNKTGFICSSNTSFQELALKINALIKNKKKLTSMSRYVTKHFWGKLYDYGESYNLYFELYSRVIKNNIDK